MMSLLSCSAAATLARRGTAEAITAAAQVAAEAAAAEAADALQPSSSIEQRQLHVLSQQLTARAAAVGAAPAEPPASCAGMPVVVVDSSPAGASAAAKLGQTSTFDAPGCGGMIGSTVQQQLGPGASAHGRHLGLPHSAAAVTAAGVRPPQSREKQTIPMSQALAVRPWQLRSCAAGTADGSGGGEDMLRPGQQLAYSSDQLLCMCGAMAHGRAPGEAYVAAEKARARAAELDILLPQLPPPPPELPL